MYRLKSSLSVCNIYVCRLQLIDLRSTTLVNVGNNVLCVRANSNRNQEKLSCLQYLYWYKNLLEVNKQ
jgi:hypothetical protein